MTAEMEDLAHFVEPEHGGFAGEKRYARALAPYDKFMQDEGLPVIREIGIRDLRDVELVDWARTGGRGSYIQLLGTEELWGMYVIEVPPGGAPLPGRALVQVRRYRVSLCPGSFFPVIRAYSKPPIMAAFLS